MSVETELSHVYDSIKLGNSPSQRAPVPIPKGVEAASKAGAALPRRPGPPIPPYLGSSEPASLQGTQPQYTSLEQVALTPANEYSTVDTRGEKDSLHSEKVVHSTPAANTVKTQKLKRGNKLGKGLSVGDYSSGIIALLALLVAIIALSMSATSLSRKCECSNGQGSYIDQTEQIDELRDQLNSTQRDVASLIDDGLTSVLDNCEMSIGPSCTLSYSTVGTPPTYTLCETSRMRVERPGFYTKDIQCGISDLDGQINPVVSTLLFDEMGQRAWCSCYGMVPSGDTVVDSNAEVVCSLLVTRCAYEP